MNEEPDDEDSSPATKPRGGNLEEALSKPKSKVIVLQERAEVDDRVALVEAYGKKLLICRNSLYVFNLHSFPRKHVLRLIQWKWFDRFILLCILMNSLLLATYQWRPSGIYLLTNEINFILSNVLTGIFTAECALKIIGWGLFVERGSYLRDPWNFLDFIVVVSGIIEWIPFIEAGSLSFLRLFRVLRPLRSLNAYPEMKLIVNTTISAIPRLGNVTIMGLFIFAVFAIIGITLMPGIFYHRCREISNPLFCETCEPGGCWQWPYTTSDSAGRLCGGRYMCEAGEFCRGHPDDPDPNLRPVFVAGHPAPRDGGKWCAGSEPSKWSMTPSLEVLGFPETDFVHFDNIGGAFLLVFQCMTMEGWTDIMYYVQDGVDTWVARVYFIVLIIMASFFLLNIALAVVDEARGEFDDGSDDEAKEDDGGDPSMKVGDEDVHMEEELEMWWDTPLVKVCQAITHDEIFSNFILLIIMGNVVVMTLEKFPPDVSSMHAKFICNVVFMIIFIIEMFLELIARGPKGYVTNPTTAFDGFVVIISLVELGTGGEGGLKALRTLRLFRVLNKLAKRFPALGVLLKAIVGTGSALRYWLVLFILSLCIFTLMMMNFFANEFHFEEGSDPPEAFAKYISKPGQSDPWCPGTTEKMQGARDACIPRAHFDTFTWGFVTVFQIMTGENWNTIMYAGMRAGGWGFALLFIFLILFGQTLVLSLFLSMLISKFGEFQNKLTTQMSMKRAHTSISSIFAERGVVPTTANSTKEGANSKVSRVVPMEQPGGDKGPQKENKSPTGGTKLGWQEDTAQEDPRYGPWPKGYAWFVLTPVNPIRRGATWLLTVDLAGHDAAFRKRKKEQERALQKHQDGKFSRQASMSPKTADSPLIFDNFILVCILCSTLCMMIDGPLEDQDKNVVIWVIRTFLDPMFSIIFIVEMVIKLAAYPLVWGEGAYFWSPGCSWNWLDAVVVTVSVIDFSPLEGPTFLKTLRILRAFRPLRVINRNPNLKLVIETIAKSMQELGWLLVVFILFLLIFALMFLMFLKGHFGACSEEVAFLRDVGKGFVAPLCFASTFSLQRDAVIAGTVEGVTSGSWNAEDGVWEAGTCTSPMLSWQRASADTPICVAACDPMQDPDGPNRPSFCPRKYTIAEELPSLCGDPLQPGDPGMIGEAFVSEMQRTYTVPCGGSTPESARAGTANPLAPVSCREAFCSGGVSDDKVESCKSDCEIHPDFCTETCGNCKGDGCSDECLSCRMECEAACQCDFCEPLIKDAALCHEQGQQWVAVVSQNFNNIFNAMLTLLEISTTEGWVDVMYAACDAVDVYVQPVRDTSHGFYVPLFVAWIFWSFMFLLNLGVGVIVDKFMDMREVGQNQLSDSQKRWAKNRKHLYGSSLIFSMENLHVLQYTQRRVYDLVESRPFDTIIMGCIVLNTVAMGMKVFPEPMENWDVSLGWLNYFFAAVYTLEAALKLFAYRSNYFKNSWNCFDFFCVVATFVGIFLTFGMSGGPNIAPIMSVLRIFRIARLFRLLKFMKGLNKLFMALMLSLPKLVNVVGILLLFLVLFSILGVQLFATTKPSETLNEHGNFQDFWRAFTTLFRASTGEAWNEVMHDLGKGEVDFFREGSWCAPAELYDTSGKFDVLQSKCLIENPNSCVQTLWGWNAIPYVYWVLYTLLIGLVVMNLVISVILDGYEESKQDTSNPLQICKELWPEYDPDLRMSLPLKDACRFICQAVESLTGEHIDLEGGIARMPMKYVRAFDLMVNRGMDGQVHFKTAARQVIRFVEVVENDNPEKDILKELDATDDCLEPKERRRLRDLESRAPQGLPHMATNGNLTATDKRKQDVQDSLAGHVAVLRLQSVQRGRQARKDAQSRTPRGAKEEPDLATTPPVAG